MNIPEAVKPNPKEIDIAIQLINHLSTKFKPAEYKDTYSEELKKIIIQKSKGRPIHPKGEEPKMSKVQDIMSLLKASLDEKKKPTKRIQKKSHKKTA